jgi:hypothetical protein
MVPVPTGLLLYKTLTLSVSMIHVTLTDVMDACNSKPFPTTTLTAQAERASKKQHTRSQKGAVSLSNISVADAMHYGIVCDTGLGMQALRTLGKCDCGVLLSYQARSVSCSICKSADSI